MSAPSSPCPELEALFAELEAGVGPALEHSRSCAACSAILEEHRQLEKDLFRLADPLPPPELLRQVMAKVAATPAPLRTELAVAVGILSGVAALLIVSLMQGQASAGSLGVSAAETILRARLLVLGLGSALSVLWRTAAVPVTAALAMALLLSLIGLKRIAGPSVALELGARR